VNKYTENVLHRSLILSAFTFCIASGQTVPQLLSTVSGTTQYRETAVSPDGHYAAWTVTLRNKDDTQSRNSEIYLLDISKNGAAARKLSSWNAPHAEHSIAWSPDSRQIAFLSMPRR
jgi:hypothetical protein